MGTAASGQPAGEAGLLDELEDLRFHWGTAYDFDCAGGEFTARRRDARGGALTDLAPARLLGKIRADYAADPVPRDRP
jgi:hypothetical protein